MTNGDKFAVSIIVSIAILFASVLTYGMIDSARYKDVESMIVVKERYNGIANKKDAIDKCIGLLDANGFILHEATSENHAGKMFVVVKGLKHVQK